MSKTAILGSVFALAIGLLASPGSAYADGEPRKGANPLLAPEKLSSRIGIGMSVGIGVLEYFDADTRNFTRTAVAWDGRIIFGTRSWIGLEVAYVGTLQGVHATDLVGARLIGNGVEGGLRFNIPIGRLFATVFGGVGYMHLNVQEDGDNLSNLEDEESFMTVPFGAGLGGAYNGLYLQARATFRPAFYDSLREPFLDELDEVGDSADLHSWQAMFLVGWEF